MATKVVNKFLMFRALLIFAFAMVGAIPANKKVAGWGCGPGAKQGL